MEAVHVVLMSGYFFPQAGINHPIKIPHLDWTHDHLRHPLHPRYPRWIFPSFKWARLRTPSPARLRSAAEGGRGPRNVNYFARLTWSSARKRSFCAAVPTVTRIHSGKPYDFTGRTITPRR